jgi:hypothetical protein
MTPDYKANDPRGWCGDPKRGAALGRPTIQDAPADFSGRISVRRVHLNAGGYDSNGTYFGSGTALYWAASDDGEIDYMLRAPGREAARDKVLAKYPHAKIRRGPKMRNRAKVDRDYLRQVDVDGYVLRTWDHRRDGGMGAFGKPILGYELASPDGKVLFTGEDYGCSPMHAIDSDDAVRGVLFFLTRRPGDTDADYFANYTPEQMVFAKGDAEALSMWAMEDADAPAFINLDGWINE